MMNCTRIGVALGALLLATGLGTIAADAQERRQGASRERAERPMPGRQRADPGRVAATDIAFARAARDNGQWSAFREYAAPGAQLQDDGPPFDAATSLATRIDPAQALRWAPTAVWSSCDGSLAVSFGRSRAPDGIVGSYVTVWQRQHDGAYRWLYGTETPDNPQPPPPPAPVAPDENTIVVEELGLIQARTADCVQPQARAPAAVPTAAPLSPDTRSGGGEASDRTLRWRREDQAPGQWRVVVDWVRDGQWQEALAFEVPDS